MDVESTLRDIVKCCVSFADTGSTSIREGKMISVELGSNFLLKQKIFLFGDKLLPVIQHGFLRSTENVYLHNLLVLFGKILLPLILSGGIVGRCYYLFVTDSNATI